MNEIYRDGSQNLRLSDDARTDFRITSGIWDPYKNLLGSEIVEQLFQIARLLKGSKIVHVNSTREGGGVAEILSKMVPLMNGLGLDTRWEVVEGDAEFFQCTKTFHNLLQGFGAALPSKKLLQKYEETNEKNAQRLMPILQDADFVLIHDPQPLSMMPHFKHRKGKWIWRCHIETSTASRTVWKYLRPFIDGFDAGVFSLETFSQAFPFPTYIIPPSIDPFSEKNIDLETREIENAYEQFKIDLKRPVVLQISRFDRFKDPIGVIKAFRLSQKYNKGIQLVLAGGSADDDPEGAAVYQDVLAGAQGDPDIFVLNLPPNAHRLVNALQRGASIVLQKSIKEGFGLTITEALWKAKPVIGGNTGGIRIQLFNHYTGLLANTPEGAANWIRYLLQQPEKGKEFGLAGKTLVKENYLITRQIRDYLTLMATLIHPGGGRIELGGAE